MLLLFQEVLDYQESCNLPDMVIEMGNQVSQYFAFHTFFEENQMTNYQKINPIKNKNEITVKL